MVITRRALLSYGASACLCAQTQSGRKRVASENALETINQLITVLLTLDAPAEEVRRVLAPKTVQPMPPNQESLIGAAVADFGQTELVYSADNAPGTPVKKLNLMLSESSRLTLGELAARAGRWDVVPAEHRPAPAELVRFANISAPRMGVDVILTARVDRPVTADSKVRSIQMTRSVYSPKL
jgi:hypothetical protein